jgi:hypothetical protein
MVDAKNTSAPTTAAASSRNPHRDTMMPGKIQAVLLAETASTIALTAASDQPHQLRAQRRGRPRP